MAGRQDRQDREGRQGAGEACHRPVVRPGSHAARRRAVPWWRAPHLPTAHLGYRLRPRPRGAVGLVAVAALALGACGPGSRLVGHHPDSECAVSSGECGHPAHTVASRRAWTWGRTPSPSTSDSGCRRWERGASWTVSRVSCARWTTPCGRRACLSGEAGAIVLTTEGTLDHGCVQGSVGQADGGVEDLGVGTAVTLGGGRRLRLPGGVGERDLLGDRHAARVRGGVGRVGDLLTPSP